MKKEITWVDKKEKEKRSFLKYEALFYGFMELREIEKRSITQEFWYQYAAWYITYWHVKRTVIGIVKTKLREKRARYDLKRFYETHTSPYSQDEKCLLLSLHIATPEGRSLLAKVMVAPLKKKYNT